MARGNSDPGGRDPGPRRPAGAAPPESVAGDPAPGTRGPQSEPGAPAAPGSGVHPAPGTAGADQAAAAPETQSPPAARERGRKGGGFPLTFLRVVALLGVLGIAVAVGAILAGQDVEGWLTALIVSALSIILTVVALVMRP